MMTNIEFKKYCWLMNRIAYWLILNKKNVFTAKEYTFFGKSKTLHEIKEIIKKNGTKYGTDVFVTRFVEYAIMHTNTYGNFPTSVYSLNNKSRLSREQYVEMVKTVWEYERTNKKYPTLIEVPTIKTFKKYGRSTKQGCDNRGQNTSYNCGPHMAQEIIRNLTGKIIPQSTIASVMGTTTRGTGHSGINTFFAWFNKKYGYNLKVEWKNFNDIGWNGIKKIIESDNQDCGLHELYRDTWGHYTNFDKIYSSTVDVHNSLGNSCSGGCYCGYTENRTKSSAERYLKGISQKSVLIITQR